MDYDGLRLFLHLSRTLHFLRTSRACHVSPSALSRAVQRLERETGSPLLERDRRSVRLTAAGARFAEHARDTLERWQRLQRDLRGRRDTLSGQHRALRLGHRLPELPPRAARRLPPAPPRHPHPARDRLRRRRARAAGRGARRRQRGRDPAAAAARAGVARAAAHAAGVRGAARGVRGRAPVPPAAAAVGEAAHRAAGVGPGARQRRPLVPAPAHRAARLRRGPRQRGDPRAGQPGLRRRHRAAPRARREPAARQARVLDTDDGGAALGEFRVGVCTQRKKLASPLVRALWDSFAAVHTR